MKKHEGEEKDGRTMPSPVILHAVTRYTHNERYLKRRSVHSSGGLGTRPSFVRFSI